MKELIATEVHIFQKHGQLVTTSLDLAEKFVKRHDRVIRKIVEINNPRLAESTVLHLGDSLSKIQEWFSANFFERKYVGDNGKSLPMYEMTKAGFSVLAMGFTGIKALEWKIKYEQAFSMMEQTLLNQRNLSWQASRQQGKLSRLEETDTIKNFIEYAAKQGSSKPNWYYKHITNATYKALFIITDKFPGSFRDLLDNAQLSFLATAEHVAAKALLDGMSQGLFYKDIFILAKSRLESLGKNVGVSRIASSNPQMIITEARA